VALEEHQEALEGQVVPEEPFQVVQVALEVLVVLEEHQEALEVPVVLEEPYLVVQEV
tara:strand:+ start:598 stop:768 length:171 start_codon:yes stop_codon:yes gene_type:complete